MTDRFSLPDVREHTEGEPVELAFKASSERWVVLATNEGGYNVTAIDLIDLLRAVAVNAKINRLVRQSGVTIAIDAHDSSGDPTVLE